MSFKEYLNEKEENEIFPSDEEIADVANSADEAFWKIVVDQFKGKLESADFKPGEELGEFKEKQKEAIKDWLKSNWPKIEDKKNRPKEKNLRGGVQSFEPPATNKASATQMGPTGSTGPQN